MHLMAGLPVEDIPTIAPTDPSAVVLRNTDNVLTRLSNSAGGEICHSSILTGVRITFWWYSRVPPTTDLQGIGTTPGRGRSECSGTGTERDRKRISRGPRAGR